MNSTWTNGRHVAFHSIRPIIEHDAQTIPGWTECKRILHFITSILQYGMMRVLWPVKRKPGGVACHHTVHFDLTCSIIFGGLMNSATIEYCHHQVLSTQLCHHQVVP